MSVCIYDMQEQRWYRGNISSFAAGLQRAFLYLQKGKVNYFNKEIYRMEKNLAKTYNPKDFEDRIYEMWEQKGAFRADAS